MCGLKINFDANADWIVLTGSRISFFSGRAIFNSARFFAGFLAPFKAPFERRFGLCSSYQLTPYMFKILPIQSLLSII